VYVIGFMVFFWEGFESVGGRYRMNVFFFGVFVFFFESWGLFF